MKMSVFSPINFARQASFFAGLVFFAFLLFFLTGSHWGRAEQAETPAKSVSPIPVSPIPISPISALPLNPESGKGSSPDDQSVSEREEVPWIFIPLDSEGKRAGENLYVPLEILQKHFQESKPLTDGLKRGFVFRKALYAGTVSQNLTSRDLTVDSIRATYEVEVLIPETKIAFPFTQSQIYLVPGSVLLNGEVFQIVWEDGHPVVNFAKTGRYLVEFTLIPIVEPMEPASSSLESETERLNLGSLSDSAEEPLSSAGNEFSMSGFRFSIPEISSARLELQVPQGVNSIEFPTALGSQEYDQNSRTWLVHLGATPQLTVQWKTQNTRSGMPGLLTAEELCRWKIGERSQSLECRTRFHSSEEAFARMEWVVDSRMVFKPEDLQIFIQTENRNEDPSTGTGNTLDAMVNSAFSRAPTCFFVPYSGEKNVQTRVEGKICRIVLTLARPVSEPLLVVFQLENTSAGNIGSYQLPLVRTEKTKVTHRWFQVISEPNFHLELPQTQGVPLISPQEFMSVWEELTPVSVQNPDLYMESTESENSLVIDDTQLVGQSHAWTIKSGPLPSISTIHENLFCAFDKDLVAVQFLVQFASPEAIPALFHLQIPEGLNVQKVILHDGMTQKNLRFSRSQNDRLGIFYDKISPDAEESSGTSWNDESPVGIPELDPVLPSILPESIPSPVVKRSAEAEVSTVCSVEIMGTLDIWDFVPKKEMKFPFPEVRVSEPSLHSVLRTVHLFRSSRVLVTCPIPPGCREMEESASRNISGLFTFENLRLVSAFSVPPQEPIKTVVQIRQNQPKVLVNTRTFLRIPREMTVPTEDGSLKLANPVQRNELNPGEVSPLDPSAAEVSGGESAMAPESVLSGGKNDLEGGIADSSSTPQLLTGISSAALPDESLEESPVYSSNSHWQMTMEMLLTVEKGLVDEIVLEMPASISQPYILEPPMPYELEPISNQEISSVKAFSNEKTSKAGAKNPRDKKTKKNPASSSDSEKKETGAGDVSSRTASGISSASSKPEAWVRMVIHPRKPISGNLALRLTADIQETPLDSSVQNSLVRLSNLRFPGITVQNQDVLLPALRSESRKEQFRWFTEGMIPLSVSRMTIPTSASGADSVLAPASGAGSTSGTGSTSGAGPSETETGLKFENPFTLEWKSSVSGTSGGDGNLFRIYHVIEEHSFAQLQIQSFDLLNPAVELTTHSIFWNPEKEFLGVTSLDIIPQKAQTCILRLPSKMELLEVHLDSRPVQLEEVVWDETRSEFLPVSAVQKSASDEGAISEAQKGAGMEYRTFRVTLRSLQLPQHLEILYHGKVSDWKSRHFPESNAEPRGGDRLYQLDFPVLLQQRMNEIVPINSHHGTAFFFLPNDSKLNLWSIALEPLVQRSWGREQIVCLERLRDLLARVSSPRLAGSVTPQERSIWLENWHLLWFGMERLIERTFLVHPESATEEIRQNFQQIQAEGARIFAESLAPESLEDKTLARNFNEFRQNSLWLVFIRNLPDEVKSRAAFETGSSSRFYILEKAPHNFALPEHTWAVLYTLLFTLMISLGLYCYPTLPEDVRTAPFWLFCSGSLWLFCGLNIWIGLALLVLSIGTLGWRIMKLVRED